MSALQPQVIYWSICWEDSQHWWVSMREFYSPRPQARDFDLSGLVDLDTSRTGGCAGSYSTRGTTVKVLWAPESVALGIGNREPIKVTFWLERRPMADKWWLFFQWLRLWCEDRQRWNCCSDPKERPFLSGATWELYNIFESRGMSLCFA